MVPLPRIQEWWGPEVGVLEPSEVMRGIPQGVVMSINVDKKAEGPWKRKESNDQPEQIRSGEASEEDKAMVKSKADRYHEDQEKGKSTLRFHYIY